MYKAIILDFFGVVHDGQEVNTEVMQLVRELKAGYKVGLLSNSNRGLLRPLLEQEGLTDVFDGIVVSGEAGVFKPDPAIFIHALEQMKLQPAETLFIDDSPRNADAALSVGIRSIIFTGEPALRRELRKLNII